MSCDALTMTASITTIKPNNTIGKHLPDIKRAPVNTLGKSGNEEGESTSNTQCECSCPAVDATKNVNNFKTVTTAASSVTYGTNSGDYCLLPSWKHNRTKRLTDEFTDLMGDSIMFMETIDDRYRKYYHTYNGPLVIVRGVEAIIGADDLNDIVDHKFDVSFDENMIRLNARGYGSDRTIPRDDKGHLIAARFGGPAIIQNLAPQSPLLNRGSGVFGRGVEWTDRENQVKEWLTQKGLKCQLVRWRVAVLYDLSRSNRPKGFLLFVDFSGQTLSNRQVWQQSVRKNYSNEINCVVD